MTRQFFYPSDIVCVLNMDPADGDWPAEYKALVSAPRRGAAQKLVKVFRPQEEWAASAAKGAQPRTMRGECILDHRTCAD